MKMSSEETKASERDLGWAPLRRFLPYLWPAGEPALRARVVLALLLVLVAKAATLTISGKL